MSRFVVRHHRYTDATWHVVGYFESAREALAEYEELQRAYRRERVWVVDLVDDVVIADSRIK